jgi:hypothetical protein
MLRQPPLPPPSPSDGPPGLTPVDPPPLGSPSLAIEAITRAAAWLVLPLGLLLFLQWPLRDGLRAGSQQANDMAQWLFALYTAAAVTRATRSGTHLGIRRIGTARGRMIVAFCVLPWSAFVLIEAAAPVWRSIRQLEAFPETYNPGYFLVRLAAWLLALLLAAQSLLDLFPRRGPDA